MNKYYQTIIVNHKEEEGKTTHWLDDENYKTLCKERAEQLKEIERLNNIINKLENYLSSKKEMIEVELVLDKLQRLKGSE